MPKPKYYGYPELIKVLETVEKETSAQTENPFVWDTAKETWTERTEKDSTNLDKPGQMLQGACAYIQQPEAENLDTNGNPTGEDWSIYRLPNGPEVDGIIANLLSNNSDSKKEEPSWEEQVEKFMHSINNDSRKRKADDSTDQTQKKQKIGLGRGKPDAYSMAQALGKEIKPNELPSKHERKRRSSTSRAEDRPRHRSSKQRNRHRDHKRDSGERRDRSRYYGEKSSKKRERSGK